MYETPSRDRGDGRAIRSRLACPELVAGKPLPRGRNFSGGLCPPYILAKGTRAGGRGLSEARHMWSHYRPSLTGRPSGLSTTIPPEGRASFFTINGATMCPC